MEEAADGAEALQKAAAGLPCVVVTDLVMPGVDGLGLLRGLRAELPFTSVILLTGQGSIETAVAAMEEGADDYLTKPVDPARLRLLVPKAAEKGEALREVVRGARAGVPAGLARRVPLRSWTPPSPARPERRKGMRLPWTPALVVLTAMVLSGCVTRTPGPLAGVLSASSQALVFGASAAEVLAHPALRDKVESLYGADWAPAPRSGGRLGRGAAAFFGQAGPPRLVRVGAVNYVAVTGCVPEACATHRGLLLVREDGEELLSRIDEGGFSHYYAYALDAGGGVIMPVLDAAARALERARR